MRIAGTGMVMAAILTACATAESPDRTDVVLLMAHINSIEVGEPLDQGSSEDIAIGTRNTLSATATETLIGRMDRRDFSIVVPMTSVPRLGGDHDEILVLAQVLEGGELRPVQWSYAAQGMCINAETARALSIESEVSNLTASGRLNCT